MLSLPPIRFGFQIIMPNDDALKTREYELKTSDVVKQAAEQSGIQFSESQQGDNIVFETTPQLLSRDKDIALAAKFRRALNARLTRIDWSQKLHFIQRKEYISLKASVLFNRLLESIDYDGNVFQDSRKPYHYCGNHSETDQTLTYDLTKAVKE